jgi:hypothetical protein
LVEGIGQASVEILRLVLTSSHFIAVASASFIRQSMSPPVRLQYGSVMKRIACIVGLLLLPLVVHADDSVRVDVKTTPEPSSNIVENGPLRGRKYGVEANPVRLVTSDIRFDDPAPPQFKHVSFSGTVSYFSSAQNAEIALPIFYETIRYAYEGSGEENQDFKLITLDVHYRRFLGRTIKGFYVSGFGRFARLRGRIGGDSPYSDIYSRSGYHGRDTTFDENAHPYATENKFGIGVGIGFRLIFKHGIYWGNSVSVGRYFVGKNDQFLNVGIRGNDKKRIFDWELLKVGYAF